MELRPALAEPVGVRSHTKGDPSTCRHKLSHESPRAGVRRKDGMFPWTCLLLPDGIVSSGLGSLAQAQHGVWDKPTDRQAMVIGITIGDSVDCYPKLFTTGHREVKQVHTT